MIVTLPEAERQLLRQAQRACRGKAGYVPVTALLMLDRLPDVRDLAPAVRQLFPAPAYQVGCGGSHIWLHRADDSARLACIIDRYQ